MDAVISFPKSGRTWLRVMLDELGVPVEYTHAGADHSKALKFDQLDTAEAENYERIVFLYHDPRDTAVSGDVPPPNRTIHGWNFPIMIPRPGDGE